VQQRSNKRRGTLKSAGSGIVLVRPETSGQDSENVNVNAPPIFQRLIAEAFATQVATEASQTGVPVTGSHRFANEVNGLNR